MVEFVAAAAKALPELIEQLEIGLTPKTDVHLLMKQVEAFAEGDAAAGTLTAQSLRMPAATPRAGRRERGRPRWIPCSPTSSSRRCAVTSRSCASSRSRRATTRAAPRR